MRVPSKNPADALAQCVAAYGERGIESGERITSINRGLARIWLCSNGVPARTVAKFTLEALREIWADASDELLNMWKAESPNVTAQSAPASDNSDDGDEAEKLAKALRAFTASRAKQAPLDEQRVKELIEQHSVKTVRHEIVFNGKAVTLPTQAFHPVFPEVLAAIAAGLNVLLVGPAGSGKTHLCEQISKALSLDFSFTGAVLQEHKLLGFRNPMGEVIRTSFRDRYENGGVFLFDEMDASSPVALLAFNAGLANSAQDFPDACVPRHPDFRAVATANTKLTGQDRQYVGRNQLDAASADRFYMVEMDYSAEVERAIYCGTSAPSVSLYKPRLLTQAEREQWVTYVQKARAGVALHGIRHVVSARAIASGIKALEAGIPRSKVETAVLWKSMSAADISRVKGSF